MAVAEEYIEGLKKCIDELSAPDIEETAGMSLTTSIDPPVFM